MWPKGGLVTFLLLECHGIVGAQEAEDGNIWTSRPGRADVPLSPSSNFASLEDKNPPFFLKSPATSGPDVHFPRGRDVPVRMYIGQEAWNTFGDMTHRRAVLAMLGDPYAYYESPMFTAYKLLSLGRVHELSDHVFPGKTGGPRSGHLDSDPDGAQRAFRILYADVAARAFNESYMDAFPRAATEADAVRMAKALLDDVFHDSARDWSGHGGGGGGGGSALENAHAREVSTLCFGTMSYRTAAAHGRSVIVLAPEARLRSIDNAYLRLRRRQGKSPDAAIEPTEFAKAVAQVGGYGGGDSNGGGNSGGSSIPVCNCADDHFAEVVTPGYHLPEHVVGAEDSGFGLYKVTGANGGRFVAIVQARGRCVTQPVADGRFLECAPEPCGADPRYCGVRAPEPTAPQKVLPVAGLIYAYNAAGKEDGAEATQRRGEAHELFERLNEGARRPKPTSPSPFEWPIGWLTTLQDLEFTAGGMRTAALLVGERAVLYDVFLNTVGVPRPQVAAVLRGRAVVPRSGGGGGGSAAAIEDEADTYKLLLKLG